jgi:ribonuclease BN (tRNA processing enzyme)
VVIVSGELRLTILGCDGSYAGPDGACSGYLIRSATTTVWIDCGPGTLANVQRHIELADLDALIVSHQHPDHCAELPIIYNAGRYYVGMDPLPVHTTAGVQALTDPQVGLGSAAELFEWVIHSDGDTFEVGDMTITFSLTDHPVETYAMRIESGGSSLVYTADTGPGWHPAELGSTPDMILGEGTILAASENSGIPHLSARQLGERAREVGAGRVVLTHVPPSGDPEANQAEATEAFGRQVELATTGSTFLI